MPSLEEHYFVDMKVDGASFPLVGNKILLLRVFENTLQFSPVVQLVFNDRANILTEAFPFTGQEVFELGWGPSKEEIQYHTFVYFKGWVSGGFDTHLYTMFLVSQDAQKLLTPKRLKSYASMRIDEVVEDIAEEQKLESVTEETSISTNWFCPGWSYAQFLRWLSNRAMSAQHSSSGFLHFVDLDSKLNFYSIEHALRRKQSTVFNVTPIVGDEDTDKELSEYRLTSRPGPLHQLGGYGHTVRYFDYETGTFGSAASDPSIAQYSALCDWVALESEQLDQLSKFSGEGSIYSGDDVSFLVNKLEAGIIRLVNTIFYQEVMVEGNLDYRAGQRVKVTLPSPWKENIINQVFSGQWLIERVTHQIVPIFATKLVLCRSGVNAADDRKLVFPIGGVV